MDDDDEKTIPDRSIKLTEARHLVHAYNQAIASGRDSSLWAATIARLRDSLDLLREVAATLPADSTEYKQFESAISAAEDANNQSS